MTIISAEQWEQLKLHNAYLFKQWQAELSGKNLFVLGMISVDKNGNIDIRGCIPDKDFVAVLERTLAAMKQGLPIEEKVEGTQIIKP
jgi:hypothetical protein